MLKQYTGSVSYINEACRIHVNGDPVLDPDFDPAEPDHTPQDTSKGLQASVWVDDGRGCMSRAARWK